MPAWDAITYQTKTVNGWTLTVFYRPQQQGWVFQAAKGTQFHYSGLRHEKVEQAQQAAWKWSTTR